MKAHKFELAVARVIRNITGQCVSTSQEIFNAFTAIPCRKNIWMLVSDYYGCIPQEAHDFYHNMWSKQFSDSFTEFKQELHQLVELQIAAQDLTSSITKQVISMFLEAHPDKHFHKLSLNQYVHHYIARLQKQPKVNKSECSQKTESQNSEVTVSDIQALLKYIQVM
ncbi:Conserved_hypothetical protein [Hexamita inflata]|uniref:Uncharacterized protein n=1 Tax=Hexamita inflata TaxID=28002 RepID=A0AA86UV23_9EUKA|nr:Conserved hypothetical protein [Hexamita inflata]